VNNRISTFRGNVLSSPSKTSRIFWALKMRILPCLDRSGSFLPIDGVSHPRGTISAVMQLWYTQNSQPWGYKKLFEIFDWLSMLAAQTCLAEWSYLVMMQEVFRVERDRSWKSSSNVDYWVKTQNVIVDAFEITCSFYGPTLRSSREDPDTFFIPLMYVTTNYPKRLSLPSSSSRCMYMYLIQRWQQWDVAVHLRLNSECCTSGFM
jgi:hypothetical protein